MAKCNQLTSLPFKGLTQSFRPLSHYRNSGFAHCATLTRINPTVGRHYFDDKFIILQTRAATAEASKLSACDPSNVNYSAAAAMRTINLLLLLQQLTAVPTNSPRWRIVAFERGSRRKSETMA